MQLLPTPPRLRLPLSLLLLLLVAWCTVPSSGHFLEPALAPDNAALLDAVRQVDDGEAFLTLPTASFPSDRSKETLQFAVHVAVDLPLNTWAWIGATDKHRVARLGLLTPQADVVGSLQFLFSRFVVPRDTLLFVFSPETERALVYRREDVVDGQLWTSLLYGTRAVLYLAIPLNSAGSVGSADTSSKLDVHLARASLGYQSVGVASSTTTTTTTTTRASLEKSHRTSGFCEINIACPQGQPWLTLGRSVVSMVINQNLLCTGTLINNVRQDRTPYVLTAHHCITSLLPSGRGSFTFFWNYDAVSCEGTHGPLQSSSGGRVVASYNMSDSALLLLTGSIPESVGPVFAGWDRTGLNVVRRVVTAIHHPRGAEKKISFSNNSTALAFYSDFGQFWGPVRNHIRVVWDVGTTEPGSSGSAIFNAAGHIVGHLHGGLADCVAFTAPDWCVHGSVLGGMWVEWGG
jgi:lysyl endopeptidase